jgi:ribosome maturation factor RimP
VINLAGNITAKVTELVENIIIDLGYDLYDVEYLKEGKDYILRITIDNDKGINIEDCEKVSNAINDILDSADYIKDQYNLEVSSPGLERILKKDKHFEKQIGNEIYIKLYKSVNGLKEVQGVLKEYSPEKLILDVKDEKIEIECKDIAIAKTIFNW